MPVKQRCTNATCSINLSGLSLKHPYCKRCAHIVEQQDDISSERSIKGYADSTGKSSIFKYFSIVVVGVIAVTMIFFIFNMFSNDKVVTNAADNSKKLAIAKSDREVVMKIKGSNTIGAKLMPSLVQEYLMSKGAINIAKNDISNEEFKIYFNIPEEGKNYEIDIQAMGSSTAFEGLESRTCDLGMASRKIKPEELKKLVDKGLGDFSSSESEHIIGLDGIAIIVNNSNALNKITVKQLNEIYSGKINDWSQLGGKKGKIKVLSRDSNSGTHDTFKSLVMKDSEWAKDIKEYSDNKELSADVSADVNAIGYVGLPYINESKPLEVFEEGAKGFLPSTFNIATEDYALTRRLYVYSSANSKNEYVKGLIDFIYSDKGQEIISETDFVSQNIEIIENTSSFIVADKWSNEDLKKKYQNIIINSSGRLSLNIRFNSGKSTLDNKSLKDIDRLIKFMNRSKYLEYNIVLVGFTDNVGAYNNNLQLSIERANFVKSQLVNKNKSLEKRIAVMGAASDQPVASNITDEGKNKNRRVEVWLTGK